MVTGDDNEPLAGATITIKNRQGGIIVDIDGKFTIKAKTGEILVRRSDSSRFCQAKERECHQCCLYSKSTGIESAKQ